MAGGTPSVTGNAPVAASPGPFPRRVRWVLIRGLSAVVTGTVVLGVGGRLVMLASRLLHPDAVGRLTENGNRIGEVTLSGTVALVVFGGLASGVMAGVIWALVASWMPRHWWVVGPATVALGVPALIDADNRDFAILDPPGVDVLLLLGLLFAFGAALHAVDAALTRRLAPAAGDLGTALQAGLVLLVAPILIPVFGSFFSREFCFCEDPPWLLGSFLVVTAAASVWWWVAELRGAEEPPPAARRLGVVALAAAVTAGVVHAATEVAAIL